MFDSKCPENQKIKKFWPKKTFFTTADHYRGYHLWSCQYECDALSFLLDNIYVRLGTKLYRQIVGIAMGTNYAPFVADLFLSVLL